VYLTKTKTLSAKSLVHSYEWAPKGNCDCDDQAQWDLIISPGRRRMWWVAFHARTSCPLHGDTTVAYYRTAWLIATIIFVAEPGGRAVYIIVFGKRNSWNRGFGFRWEHRYRPKSLVFVVCCVGSSLCGGLITRSEDSYRVCVCGGGGVANCE